MKKSILKSLVLGLFVVTGFVACKKDDKSVPATKENLVGSYKITAISMKVGASPEANVYNEFLDDCQKDDIYKLNADFSAQIIDAGTQCDPVTSAESTWELPGNNSIVIDGDMGIIQKFDGKNLVVYASETSGDITTVLTFTYSKQ